MFLRLNSWRCRKQEEFDHNFELSWPNQVQSLKKNWRCFSVSVYFSSHAELPTKNKALTVILVFVVKEIQPHLLMMENSVTFPLNVSNMIFIFPQSLSIICLFQTCHVDHFVCWFFWRLFFYNHIINLTDEKRKYYMKIFNETSTTIYKPDFFDFESSPTSAIVLKFKVSFTWVYFISFWKTILLTKKVI